MAFIIDLLAAIGGNPGTTIEELSDELGRDVSKVRNNCHQAKHQGWVTTKMDDVTHKPGYHLTADGKAKVAAAGPSSTEPDEPETKGPEGKTEPPKTGTSDPAADVAGLMSVIYDIRKALGDSEGRIMLGELAETIQAREKQRTELVVSLQSARLEAEEHRAAPGRMHSDHWKLTEQLGDIHDALAQLLPPDWPIDPSDMSTDDIIKQLAATIAAARSQTRVIIDQAIVASEPVQISSADDAIDVLEAAKGYIVSASKRKPRRINRPEAARSAALAAVRNGAQRADVFALVPVGTAKRGAEWAGQ